jgi:hypothetical protein
MIIKFNLGESWCLVVARKAIAHCMHARGQNKQQHEPERPSMLKFYLPYTNSKRESDATIAPPRKKNRYQNEHASKDTIPKPIIPSLASTPSHVRWTVEKDCLLIRRNTRISDSRIKAAAFDLSDTLLVSCFAGHPSQPQEYELGHPLSFASFKSSV